MIWNVSYCNFMSVGAIWFQMLIKVLFLFYFIVRLTTRIANPFMLWLYMLCQVCFMCCFVVTLITQMVNSFMYWIYMFLQNAFLCCFIITLITWISKSFTHWLCKPICHTPGLASIYSWALPVCFLGFASMFLGVCPEIS